jgi:hypothetical protein
VGAFVGVGLCVFGFLVGLRDGLIVGLVVGLLVGFNDGTGVDVVP